MDALPGPVANGRNEVGLDQGGQSGYGHLPVLGVYTATYYLIKDFRPDSAVALQVRGAVAAELERVVCHRQGFRNVGLVYKTLQAWSLQQIGGDQDSLGAVGLAPLGKHMPTGTIKSPHTHHTFTVALNKAKPEPC